jgi:hypothetical protein
MVDTAVFSFMFVFAAIVVGFVVGFEIHIFLRLGVFIFTVRVTAKDTTPCSTMRGHTHGTERMYPR